MFGTKQITFLLVAVQAVVSVRELRRPSLDPIGALKLDFRLISKVRRMDHIVNCRLVWFDKLAENVQPFPLVAESGSG